MAKKRRAKQGRTLKRSVLSVISLILGIGLAIYGIFWPTTIIVGWSSLIVGLLLMLIAYKLWHGKREGK